MGVGNKAKIRAVYDEPKSRYGYRRITAALCNSTAELVNHKCVQRLTQKMGIRALIRAEKRSRHVPGISDVHVPNVLQRDFFAKAPNQKWATDLTELNVHGHKLYLSACLDLWCTCGLIVHSDQGWQCKKQLYRAMLAHHGVTQSMRRRKNCFDSAVIKSVFGTLKAEY